ncbi:hypothetical protein BJX99DRAFT_247128 [Aspergillus californicus]
MSLSESDISSLSSAPPSDEESTPMALDEPVGITKYFQKKESETPPPKRAPSPPHEYTLADHPDIAFIVMFRARFNEAFPRSTPNLGPQDIERGVAETPPGDNIERLLCALLGLVLNRKKDVERNHYQRPLEEAVQTHGSQWPKAWQGKSPLRGSRNFASMDTEERSLILWSLSSSEAIQAKLKESYKQARHEDDLNQPLSVQPWGRDSLKRRYWLIEGLDDTHFRLYRESNPALKNVTWWSVAGTIPELNDVAAKLAEEKGTNSKKLSERIKNSIPRFEGADEKRKRRDYRLARKAAFTRPEPGFSLYEGRTRGKKLKYTYSDEEDIFSDGIPAPRRSGRTTSGVSTPVEPTGPRFTASGRQIRSRAGGMYGESLLAGKRDEEDFEDEGNGTERRQRTRSTRMNGYADYGTDEDEDEGSNGGQSSGNEWQGGDEEEGNEFEGDDEEEISGDDSVINGEPPSLVVQLRYGKKGDSDGIGEQPTEKNPGGQKETGTEQPVVSTEQPPVIPPQQPVANRLSYPPQEQLRDPGTKAVSDEAPAVVIASAPREGTVQSATGPAATLAQNPDQQPDDPL